jgi:hypothetical protein
MTPRHHSSLLIVPCYFFPFPFYLAWRGDSIKYGKLRVKFSIFFGWAARGLRKAQTTQVIAAERQLLNRVDKTVDWAAGIQIVNEPGYCWVSGQPLTQKAGATP